MTVKITSDYCLKKTIFIADIQSVLFKVETERLHIFWINDTPCRVAGLSSRRPVSDPMPVHVKPKWPKRHWDGVLFDYFWLRLSVSFHQCSILIFIYTLFLPGHRAKPGTFQNNAQKDGCKRVLNRDCTADEDLTHLPVWPNPSNSLFYLL
jgi:hypothetical protein